MKKVMAFALLIVIVLSVTACSSKQDPQPTEPTVTEAVTEAVTETVAVPETEPVTEQQADLSSDAVSTIDTDYVVNVDGLLKVEAEDDYKVRIVDKAIRTGVYSFNAASGEDELVFLIKNYDDKVVRDLVICVLAHDNRNIARAIKSDELVPTTTDKYIVRFSSPVTIQPGASEQVALRTSVGDIVDFNGIVLTCKRDGSDYENVNVPSWYNTAYIGKTAVCD